MQTRGLLSAIPKARRYQVIRKQATWCDATSFERGWTCCFLGVDEIPLALFALSAFLSSLYDKESYHDIRRRRGMHQTEPECADTARGIVRSLRCPAH